MPHLDFAVNHYGKPDVAMFDFTSMYQVGRDDSISLENYSSFGGFEKIKLGW